jgi:ribosome-associated toxin RatA of RatAB toxin-antitoxin module
VHAALVLAARLALADDGWERLGTRDGIAIEARATGSRIRELRATAHSPVPPAGVMETIWKHEDYPRFLPYVTRLEVLRDDGDVRLIYEQLALPIVKDRDGTMRMARKFSPATGVYEVSSVAAPDDGPAERTDHVRIRTSAAHWRLVPATDGGTEVTYTIRADPGGKVPGWFLGWLERSATTRVLRAMLDRARETHR